MRSSARARRRACGFPRLLASRGIIPGIKVHKGTAELAFAFGETITEGLDGLRARLEEYRRLGARFAKWRATYLPRRDEVDTPVDEQLIIEWYARITG